MILSDDRLLEVDMISRIRGVLQISYYKLQAVVLRQQWEIRGILRTGLLLLLPLIFVLVFWARMRALSPPAPAHQAWSAPVAVDAPAWVDSMKQQGFATQGQYLAAQAIALAHSIYGAQENEYYADDPMLSSAIAYWKRVCHNANGSLCADAQSGNLQCVEFVTAVFAVTDDELPYISNANRFWTLYQGKPGWQEIPASAVRLQAPALGDMVAWSGGNAGHLALVVDVQPPVHGHDGSITVVQTEAPDLFDKLTWHANGRIDSWPAYTLQGFIRQQEIAPCLRQQSTPQQQRWEVLAMQAAVHYGTPAKYLLRQICQSGFQATNSTGHVMVSATGAVGIAQLSPQIAAQVPRCVIDFVDNAANCDQMPGSLPSGKGVDPTKPQEALPAAAYEMSVLYAHYRQNKAVQGPLSELQAYTMALAAYNAGPEIVDQAVNSCQMQGWLNCLNQWQPDHHTQKYINAVLGSNVSAAPIGRNP
jgi:hypothetical protein